MFRFSLFFICALFAPTFTFAQTQLLQDTNEIGVPRQMVDVPVKKGMFFVLAAGSVQKVSGTFDTIPFNTFLDSKQLKNGLACVKVRELHGSLGFEPAETAYTDTYIDTFNLKNVYKDLSKKISQYGKGKTKISDYADNEIIVSKRHQKIMIQKVAAGILLKWSFETGNEFAQVVLTPNGEFVDFKQQDSPKNYTPVALVWHLGSASFGLW